MTAEADIRQVVDQWSKAMAAKDIKGVMAHTAPACVVYSLAPPLRTPRESPDGLAGWFETWRGPIGYAVTELDVTTDGDVAFCHSLNHLTGTKTTGETADLWFRHTLGLRRADGVWTIVHEHESVPFYMDGSFKAAIDLKP